MDTYEYCDFDEEVCCVCDEEEGTCECYEDCECDVDECECYIE